MSLVFPNETIARRWQGALEARLLRAPLEAFLKARSLASAPAGVAQDSDNLTRATVMIVEAGLARHLGDRGEGPRLSQQAVIGHVACLVSRSLTQMISHPATWRIVALVSAARVLSPWMGLNAAAISAASSMRQFQKDLVRGLSSLDLRIIDGACAAIQVNDAESLEELSSDIASRLDAMLSMPRGHFAEDQLLVGG
jgi:hypothetical protein